MSTCCIVFHSCTKTTYLTGAVRILHAAQKWTKEQAESLLGTAAERLRSPGHRQYRHLTQHGQEARLVSEKTEKRDNNNAGLLYSTFSIISSKSFTQYNPSKNG